MSIVYNRNRVIAQPAKAFEVLSMKVKNNSAKVKPIAFSCEIHDIGNGFERRGQRQVLINKYSGFAEMLTGLGKDNLAGIVYSFLIKINQGNSDLIEKFATRALKIAKRQHDPVHIMARTDDLRRVLSPERDRERLVRVLYDEKRALNDICNKYDSVKKRYNTLTRKMKPVEQYRVKLAAIKVDIAELIMDENPKQAICEITEAKEIMQSFGKGTITKKIDNLSRNLSI